MMCLSKYHPKYFFFDQSAFLLLKFPEELSHLIDAVSDTLTDVSVGYVDSFFLADVLVLFDLMSEGEKFLL